MWETPFERSMLYEDEGLVVSCPTQELHDELVEVLTECGCRFKGGQAPYEDGPWGAYGKDFCFFIKKRTMLYGSKDGADDGRNRTYIKCTFFGLEQFESADDKEMCDFLGF